MPHVSSSVRLPSIQQHTLASSCARRRAATSLSSRRQMRVWLCVARLVLAVDRKHYRRDRSICSSHTISDQASNIGSTPRKSTATQTEAAAESNSAKLPNTRTPTKDVCGETHTLANRTVLASHIQCLFVERAVICADLNLWLQTGTSVCVCERAADREWNVRPRPLYQQRFGRSFVRIFLRSACCAYFDKSGRAGCDLERGFDAACQP